jgi:hypothetical protein
VEAGPLGRGQPERAGEQFDGRALWTGCSTALKVAHGPHPDSGSRRQLGLGKAGGVTARPKECVEWDAPQVRAMIGSHVQEVTHR